MHCGMGTQKMMMNMVGSQVYSVESMRSEVLCATCFLGRQEMNGLRKCMRSQSYQCYQDGGNDKEKSIQYTMGALPYMDKTDVHAYVHVQTCKVK